MTFEASDIVKLLREFRRNDPTCRPMAKWADHAIILVLEFCHEALARLAAEKVRLARVVEEMLAALPAGREIRDGAEKLPYGEPLPA